ncbi:MAG: hypothetical protein ACRESK_00740 [Gammaproteobacteria bacterium]
MDARLAAKYNLFILEVVKAWIDAPRKRLRTFHHMGGGRLMVAGRVMTLPSRKNDHTCLSRILFPK